MALTSTSADGILDELIRINLSLSNIVEPSRTHRKFAVFFNLTTEEQIVTVTKDNLEDTIASLDKEQDTNNTIANNIQMWFNSGANELTIVNTSKDISTLTNIEPLNLVFVGNKVDKQLGIYQKIRSTILANKNVFFSINLGDSVDTYPEGRKVFLYLDDEVGSFFNYFAKYTEARYYTKNSFLQSDLQGTKLSNLDYIQQYNVGALVYIPSSNGYFYYNIKDRSGNNYNLDVLYQDLQADIRADLFTALSSNNRYSDKNIARLENVMAHSVQKYQNLGLIQEFNTGSLPISYQSAIDVKNGFLRGLEVAYIPTKEMQSLSVDLREEV